ncbi:MAG: TonB-dependent receptor, partial [Pseudomonadota bacterium]|nr:TonB-dependent receptor [Pseudomonadota bacterium]
MVSLFVRATFVLSLILSTYSWSAEIEEIVVTAEKRESALQDTPVAVSAVSRETIEVRGLDDFQQLQFMVPGLVFNEVADMAQMTMRGVGVDISEMSAEPGVALHVDGMYRGGLVSSAALMFDMERIEVLRGPQGTLFGRNSSGGSLNVVSRLPGEEPAFGVMALYGDYDRTRFEISGDAPIVPGKFAVRAAVSHDERDGYAKNRFTGRDEDESEVTIAKLSAVISASDRLEIILRGEIYESEVNGPPVVVTNDHPVAPLYLSTGNPGGILSAPGSCGPGVSCEDAFGLNLSPPGTWSDDPRNPYASGHFHSEREAYGFSAEVIWDVNDDVELKSISSYYELEQNCDKVSIDGSSIDALVQGCLQKNDEWSQEFALSGSSGQIDWIAGVYYYESEMEEFWDYELPAFQATFEAIFGIFGGGPPLPTGSLAFFGNKIDGSSTGVPFLHFNIFQDLTSIAAFGQTTYNFSDRLRGTVGMRWTEDEKDFGQTVVNNVGGQICIGLDLNDDWSEVTGKVGLDYDVSDTTMIYGGVSSGFKSGGFNGGSCSNPFDPETLMGFELGSKSRFFDNSMQLNLAAFYYDYEDYQARLFINNAAIVENAADAVTYGFEAELLWLVTANFRVDASLSLLSAEYEDFVSTDPLNPDVGMNCDATGLNCTQQLKG